MEEEIDLRELFMVFWKRRLFIAAFVSAVTVLSVIVTFMLPKRYEASSLLTINPYYLTYIQSPLKAAALGSGIGESAPGPESTSMKTHIAILNSSRVRESLMDILNQRDIDLKGHNISYEVESLDETSLLKLKVISDDPAAAKEAVNAWGEAYVEIAKSKGSEGSVTYAKFIRNEYEVSRSKLEELEEKISDLKIKSQIETKKIRIKKLREQQNADAGRIIELTEEKQLLEENLKNLKSEIKKHNKFVTTGSKALADEAIWRFAGDDVDAVWDKLKDKKMITQVRNPIYKEMETGIAQKELRLSNVADRINYIKKRSASLTDSVLKLEKEMQEISQNLKRLEREQNLTQTNYDAVYSRVTEAELISKINAGNTKILSRASLPGGPVKPNRKKIALLAFGISLLLSMITAGFGGMLEEYKG